MEVLSECSSQASQVFQASQSSIEVIDSNHASKRQSEERRISIAPSLDTIEDDTAKNDTLDETLTTSVVLKKSADLIKEKVVMTIGNVNLTESSSSGSVCESVVTAYDNGRKKEKSSSEEKLTESGSGLDGIFKTSSILLSKTPKPRKESEMVEYLPIQYNYDDLSIVDHRVKLHLFQNVLEENDEKLMWLVKCLVMEDEVASSSGLPFCSLFVMSTKKVNVLKIVGDESDDISSWLKKSFICNINKLEMIREISSKLGFTFTIAKPKINIHILLQDQNLADRLRVHMTTSSKF